MSSNEKKTDFSGLRHLILDDELTKADQENGIRTLARPYFNTFMAINILKERLENRIEELEDEYETETDKHRLDEIDYDTKEIYKSRQLFFENEEDCSKVANLEGAIKEIKRLLKSLK